MAEHRNNTAHRNALKAVCIFVVVLIIPAVLGVIYFQADEILTSRVIEQQQTLTDITARAVKLKLDNLVKIATSMASISQLDAYAAKDDWTDASGITRDAQNSIVYYDPYIDRIALFDENGTQEAAYPELVGGIGQSATSSAWYNSLAAGGSSFVSGVTQRLSLPRIRVVNIAAPIVSQGTLVGSLLMQVPAENFLEFSDSVSVGTYGFVYITDQVGNIVAHPRASSFSGNVMNIASTPEVAKALAGQSGTDFFRDSADGQESVATYEQVPSYGWVVVSQEPYNEVFASRNAILDLIGWVIAGSLFFDILAAFVLFMFFEARSQAKRK